MIIKIASVCIMLILSGCSLLPPKYDNNEYMQFAKLETHSRFLREECSDPMLVKVRLDQMLWDAELLNSYAFFLPRKSDIFDISVILTQDVREMVKRYNTGENPSITYCKIKSKVFTTKARRALDTIGNLQ
jgi:hypothetical protein